MYQQYSFLKCVIILRYMQSIIYIGIPAIFGLRGVSAILVQIVFIHLRTSVDDTVGRVQLHILSASRIC